VNISSYWVSSFESKEENIRLMMKYIALLRVKMFASVEQLSQDRQKRKPFTSLLFGANANFVTTWRATL